MPSSGLSIRNCSTVGLLPAPHPWTPSTPGPGVQGAQVGRCLLWCRVCQVQVKAPSGKTPSGSTQHPTCGAGGWWGPPPTALPSCLRSLPLPGCGGRPASQGRRGPIWQRKWARFLYLQARESAMLPLPKPVLSASGWGDMRRRSHSWFRKRIQVWPKEPSGPDPYRPAPHEPLAQPSLSLPATWPGSF